MAFFALLSRVVDVSTATIQARPTRDNCIFNTGMVLVPNLTMRTYSWNVPPAHTKGQMWATNAQLISLTNGCDMGIYAKISDDWSFCARDDDIWATWNCSYTGDQDYPADSWNASELVDDLARLSLLYGNRSRFTCTWDELDNTRFTQLVAWSASLGNTTGVFDIKACVDKTAGEMETKQMYCMSCSLNSPSPETKAIMSSFSPYMTIKEWADVWQGTMYQGFRCCVPLPDDDKRQGCLLYPTWIPDWLIGLSIGFVTICIATTIYYAILQYQLHHHSDKDLVKYMPIGPWEWMAQAVVEAEHTDNVRKQDLKKWYIVPNGRGGVQIEHQRPAAVNHKGRGEDKDVEMKPLTAEHEEEPAVTPLEQLNMDVRGSM
ncbi:hypothetical protein LTR78_001100 [Recurvomyces mirabilis]|uniref:Uncharacterized protein n=1 Tax=Recurvomyces mirabilis TaxID=574656 RepID=A0AAE1C657_9PEZI|nr:hypothetical protein LTR78_001100 [Recurvomyces mirabilis]KAK5159072.1 hypothetical protein LTS14_003180 [Recurvomyces mirabilis]